MARTSPLSGLRRIAALRPQVREMRRRGILSSPLLASRSSGGAFREGAETAAYLLAPAEEVGKWTNVSCIARARQDPKTIRTAP
jgi:hypothetical protein